MIDFLSAFVGDQPTQMGAKWLGVLNLAFNPIWLWLKGMFDKNIPLPSPASKWDFAQAEPGDSLSFASKPEAVKFAGAVRAYGRRANKGWGTKIAPEKKGWRVWVVAKVKLLEQQTPPRSVSVALPRVYQSFPPSTLTDDDLGLCVDLRKSDDLTFERLPAPKPVTVEDDDEAPRRRARAQPAEPKPRDVSVLVVEAAE